MRQTTFLFFVLTATVSGQTGAVTGTVTDDTGSPIAGATVSAALRPPVPAGTHGPGGLPSFIPFPPKAPTSANGSFEIDGLPAGTYALCVDKLGSAVLNPCVWNDQPVLTTLAAGGTATGVSVVAPRGVVITIRVLDPKQLLIGDPRSDDVRIGTFHDSSSFIPALNSGGDMKGKTMSLVVPAGQPLNISVSSATHALADASGSPLGNGVTQIAVPSAAVANAGSATPAVTIQVSGTK